MAENRSGSSKISEQQVRREKLSQLRQTGRDPFVRTGYDVKHYAGDITARYEEMQGTVVSVAGRLMSKRGMGKVTFCDLQDETARIQVYLGCVEKLNKVLISRY